MTVRPTPGGGVRVSGRRPRPAGPTADEVRERVERERAERRDALIDGFHDAAPLLAELVLRSETLTVELAEGEWLVDATAGLLAGKGEGHDLDVAVGAALRMLDDPKMQNDDARRGATVELARLLQVPFTRAAELVADLERDA